MQVIKGIIQTLPQQIRGEIKPTVTSSGEEYQNGYDTGFGEGLETGEYIEYLNLWNSIQANGKQTDYQFTFGGLGWNDNTFKPKYDIKPINSRFMFVNSRITDLTKILENQKVVLDTSKCIKCDSMFYLSFITNINLNLSSAENLNSLCKSAIYLETISLVISDSGTQKFNNSFDQTKKLKNITFEGVIGQDIDFSYSPLSVESMKSVITHLKNYLGTDSEYKYTVNFTSKCWNALEADSTAPDGYTWKEYVVNDLGWNA